MNSNSKPIIKRYSQAFKQQIVQEYESGASIQELQDKYGIKGNSTIQAWIKRYGRKGTRHKLLVIQSPEEQNQVKILKKRVEQLEKLVGCLSLDKVILEASLAEAEVQLGYEIKKKRCSQIIRRAYILSQRRGENMTIQAISKGLGISRQAYYSKVHRQLRQVGLEKTILDAVRAIRQRHPKMGGRKLLHQIRLEQPDLAIGRDRFFDLLARNDLLVAQKRQKRRTTWAGMWRCPNRLTDLDITRVQQVWVCDITYIETEQGFCYPHRGVPASIGNRRIFTFYCWF